MTHEEFHAEFVAREFVTAIDHSTKDQLDIVIRLNKNNETYHITAPIDEDGSYGSFTITRVTIGPVTITLDAAKWSFIVQCLDDQVLDLMEESPELEDLIKDTQEAAITLRQHLEKDYH